MNNEPVAWMDYLEHSDVYDLNVSGRGIPLYTHPAKTATDEEIDDALTEAFNRGARFGYAEGLRKAQEK